jgi:phage shock protein C
VSDPPGRPDRPPERRLTRSRSNRLVAGVCAGLADYLGIDRAMVRIAFVVLALAGGGGVVIYAIAWIAIPEGDPNAPAGPRSERADPGESARLVFGALLIAAGTILSINLIVPGVSRFFWPLALIALGVAIIVQSSAWRR